MATTAETWLFSVLFWWLVGYGVAALAVRWWERHTTGRTQ